MKTFAILCCAFFNLQGISQQQGIVFEYQTTWDTILAQAKSQNKFIFIDCYTTWCGPCMAMDKHVFPIKDVGDFYNQRFINLRLQFDTATGDNEEIKNWYSLSKSFTKEYSIKSYPTFLYFDPNGQIVHKIVGGSSSEEFIERGNTATNPDRQFYTLKEKYTSGDRDSTFLYNLIKISLSADESGFGNTVYYEYLKTQKNLFTTQNVELLRRLTKNSKDFGFHTLLFHAKKVDSILGKGVSSAIINGIILKEEVPYKINSADKADWDSLKSKLKIKYPNQCSEILFLAKLREAGKSENWPRYKVILINYMKNYKNKLPADQLNDYAWLVFLNYNAPDFLRSALAWSRKSFANQIKVEPGYIDTFANLLYKLGRKKEALAWELRGQAIAIQQGGSKSWGQETIDKLRKEKKAW